MNNFWNERWVAITFDRGGAQFVRVLGVATISMVAASCSTMQGQSERDMAPTTISSENSELPPEVRALPVEDNAPFLEFLASQGFTEVENVQIGVIAYTDTEGEKLVAFKFGGPEVGPVERFPRGYLVIPEAGVNFAKAIVIYSASPNNGQSCSTSGGSIYCNF
jgi:hypothetical protein